MSEVSPCRSAAPLILCQSNTLRAKRCETSWMTTESTFGKSSVFVYVYAKAKFHSCDTASYSYVSDGFLMVCML